MFTMTRVTVEDWALWRSVRLEALSDAPYAFGSTLSEWEGAGEARWRARVSDVAFNLVAIVDGRGVGQASGSAVDVEGRSELTSMWVSPLWRGHEIAESLVSEIARWVVGQGGRALVLDVKAMNVRARSFYRRLGFVDVGISVEDPTELTMIKTLSAVDAPE
jgi:ribosomal protein S18 acetylase RimI-like enzyme